MVERSDRAPVASFFAESAFAPDAVVVLDEAAAHHARVKRLVVGDVVRLTDGEGLVGSGDISALGKHSLDVRVISVERHSPPPPIHLRVPIADRERMLWLAEKAAELGVATWQCVRFQRSASVSPRGEGAAFTAKVRARMLGALEQSGGAWLPKLLPDTTPDALAVESNEIPIVLDVHGPPLVSVVASQGTQAPVIVWGPEGGLEANELDALTQAGWRAASVATTTLRFETAGLAAVAVCRNHQMLRER